MSKVRSKKYTFHSGHFLILSFLFIFLIIAFKQEYNKRTLKSCNYFDYARVNRISKINKRVGRRIYVDYYNFNSSKYYSNTNNFSKLSIGDSLLILVCCHDSSIFDIIRNSSDLGEYNIGVGTIPPKFRRFVNN